MKNMNWLDENSKTFPPFATNFIVFSLIYF